MMSMYHLIWIAPLFWASGVACAVCAASLTVAPECDFVDDDGED